MTACSATSVHKQIKSYVFGLPGHMITAYKDIYCTHTTEVKIYSVKKYVTTYFPCTTEMLHYFFWVISQHLHFMCLHFWILCLFHFHNRWCKQLTPPKMEQSIKKRRHMKCRIIQYSEQDENLKSRILQKCLHFHHNFERPLFNTSNIYGWTCKSNVHTLLWHEFDAVRNSGCISSYQGCQHWRHM